MNELMYLQKMDNIQTKIKKLSTKLKLQDEPIFIELVGTPKSGKTTLKKALTSMFYENNIEVVTRQETAEYNPIDKNAETYGIWMIFELFKNVSEDLANNKGKVVIYDRGILDRIPWMQYDVLRERMTESDYKKIMQIYDTDLLKKYKPVTEIYKTSPELSVQRKGKPGKFVNIESIFQYNCFLEKSLPIITKLSSYSDIVETDEYQGNINDFIIDSTYNIIEKIEKNIEVNEERINCIEL